MENQNKIGITQREEWDEKWKSIFNHYQQDLRHSFYVNAFLEEDDKRVLEMGAGSFRDMAQLNKMGIDCWGTDFSETSVTLAKNHFFSLRDKIFQSDAFSLINIKEKEFDCTFHNGLWVLFEDDQEILKLAKEQARVTKRKMIVTVHNAHNIEFIEYFKQLSKNDELYKIRFFKKNEIADIILSVCKSVKIIPVGKGKKYFEDQMINEGKSSRDELRNFFDEMGMRNLENSERLLCIGYF